MLLTRMPTPGGWRQQVARNKNGYLLTDDEAIRSGSQSHTRVLFLIDLSLPGVFACGDVWPSSPNRVAEWTKAAVVHYAEGSSEAFSDTGRTQSVGPSLVRVR